MNYRQWQLCSLVVGVAFVTTTALGQAGSAQTPPIQEKFKVVIQKGPQGLASNDFKFFYVFCKVKSPTDNVYSNPIVNGKTISATSRGPKTLSTGFSKLVEGSRFSKLIGSSQATPVNETEYIRLLVSKDWKALTAKRMGLSITEAQDKLVLASDPAVKRYVSEEKCGVVTAGKVGSIIGRVVFTVDEDKATPSGLKVTFEDTRTCRVSKISKAAKAKAATGSAYSRAKTGAKELGQKAKAKASSAWDSTKKAASSAKASVTKRFGK